MKHIVLGSTSEHFEGSLAVSLESIEQRVAIESGVFNSIANSIADVIPSLVHAAKKHFAAKDIDKWDLRFLDVNYAVLEKALLAANYMDIREIACNCPPAVNATLGEYTSALTSCMEYANGVFGKLTDYSIYLSRILSNKDERRSVRDYSLVAKDNDKARAALALEHDKLLKSGSNRTIARFGEIASSNKDFIEVQVKMVTLLKACQVVKVSDVQALIKNVVELLAALEQASQNKEINDLSPEAFRTLTTLTSVMARDVEFYAITLYRAFQAKVAYEQSAQALIKSLR